VRYYVTDVRREIKAVFSYRDQNQMFQIILRGARNDAQFAIFRTGAFKQRTAECARFVPIWRQVVDPTDDHDLGGVIYLSYPSAVERACIALGAYAGVFDSVAADTDPPPDYVHSDS
jgi:hypothetical protein